jgi:hypothetical protein
MFRLTTVITRHRRRNTQSCHWSVVPVHAVRHTGKIHIWLHKFLISALDELRSKHHAPVPDPVLTVLKKIRSLTPARVRNHIFQPAAELYTATFMTYTHTIFHMPVCNASLPVDRQNTQSSRLSRCRFSSRRNDTNTN